MALYAAMTFWLMFIVLAARGVHQLWAGMVKPRAIHIILLPGTLVAQLGHVLGLLITGATVNNTALVKNESGEPATTQDAKPRIPVIGPMVIGMLPLMACAAAIFVVARNLGQSLLAGLDNHRIADQLPTTAAGAWQMVRDHVTIVEALVNAAAAALPGTWHLWLFIYLMICLTVRMAPFPGNFRGSLGAIIVLGLLTALIALVWPAVPRYVESGWPVLSLAVPTLTFLLILSALIRGAVGLGKLIARNE